MKLALSVRYSLFVGLVGLTYSSANAATITTNSSQPTSGANDIYNWTQYTMAYNGSQDYTNNGDVGQTFTTGNSAVILNSITVQGGDSAGNNYQANPMVLSIFSVAGSTLTYIGGGSYSFADTTGATDYSTDYLTFNLSTGISLDSNTTYAFALSDGVGAQNYYGLASSVPGYFQDGINTYDGGNAILGTDEVSTSGGTTSFAAYDYDRNFDVGLTLAPTSTPEPSTWAMLLGGLGLLGWMNRRRLGGAGLR